MKNFMDDLYYGRIVPWERRPTKSAERVEINHKIEIEKHYFIEKMSLDDCKRFQQLENLYMQATGIEDADIFAYGVAFGTRFMLAIFGTGEHRSEEE